MTSEKLTPQEKALAQQLWEMAADATSSSRIAQAFQEAPQRVRDAIDSATLQSHYRHETRKNPFNH